MSTQTSEDLNTLVLVGNTDQRGRAWHYREDKQGDEPNHYPNFIPIGDVLRRLFDWEVLSGSITATAITADDMVVITDQRRQAMMRPPGALGPSDEGAILGIFMDGYVGHSYRKWLLEKVGEILDDELGISSAGLLDKGASAWVEVSVPDTITTPSGVKFRPNLLATTSFDGSLATTYKRTAQDTVCDNTRAVALQSSGGVFRVKHTRYSDAKLMEARAALELVHTIADEFTEQVEQLCNTTVTDAQWSQFLDEIASTKDPKTGEQKTGRGLTMATTKRQELERLYTTDLRCAPWNGTAHGVLQTVNTYAHHVQSVKTGGAKTEEAKQKARAARNMKLAVSGGFDTIDQDTMLTLERVLTPA